MTKRLVVEDEASAELRDAARFYEHERAGLGAELVDTIEAVFDALANGTAFSVKVPGIPDELGIRRVLVSRFPYAVVHLEERTPCTSSPSRICGGSRPAYWLGRVQRVLGSAPLKKT
jgi:hypothetical protein